MAYLVRIELFGGDTYWAAATTLEVLITRKRTDARRYRNTLNASEAARSIEATLAIVGVAATCTVEAEG